MTIFRSPDFDPLRDKITTTPVWVRLSNIPVNFYHMSILMGIARGLGNPIKVDLTTLNFERARFARVCVEVNLKKLLKGTVMVNGERYFVAYEGLPNICSGCGLYGHLIHNCPKRCQEVAVRLPATQPVEKSVMSQDLPVEEGFILVRRNLRRSDRQLASPAEKPAAVVGRNLRDITGRRDAENIVTANRYGSLGEDMVNSETRETIINSGANKENEIIGNQAIRGKSGEQVKDVVFGLNAGNGKGKMGEGRKETRLVINKAVERNGPRPKVVKQNRPARGLVFGHVRGVEETSSAGKRLRVDTESPVRRSEVYMQRNPSREGSLNLEQAHANGETQTEVEVGDGSSRMELVTQSVLSPHGPDSTTA